MTSKRVQLEYGDDDNLSPIISSPTQDEHLF